MREIKFRGKRVDNSEWVYGSLVTTDREDYVHKVFIALPSNPFACIQVIPETVGEYTGLRDKNGKEIYEGDWVKYGIKTDLGAPPEAGNSIFWDWDTGYITVDLGGFEICTKDNYGEGISYSPEYSIGYPDIIEIIGNVHEKPELLDTDDG